MPTLEEILAQDLGAEQPSMNKEASQDGGDTVTDDIEKLAMEIGLVEEDETSSKAESNQGQVKEAKMGLESLYSEMFPEEAQPASEKTASIDKEAAAVEEAMGKAAYDAFQAKVDQVITKMAQEKLAEGAKDAEPAQALENNRAGKGGEKIDTTPKVTDEVKAENGGAVVGHEQQKHAEAQKLAAYRKHLLLSQLEK